MRSRSRSYQRNSMSPARQYEYRRRSRSPIPQRRNRSASRSVSRSRYGDTRYGRRGRDISHSGDEDHGKRRRVEAPPKSRCLGVFGLSSCTSEKTIKEIFSHYGRIERINVVFDSYTGRSRGFCFIYYVHLNDAIVAKETCSGMEVDSRRIRVDYSITQRPHTPTPGVYKGSASVRDREQERDRDRSPRRRRTPSPSPRRRRRTRSPSSRRRYRSPVSRSP